MGSLGQESQDWDVIVVGGGFCGVWMLKNLRDQGFKVRLFEHGSGLGEWVCPQSSLEMSCLAFRHRENVLADRSVTLWAAYGTGTSIALTPPAEHGSSLTRPPPAIPEHE